MRPRFPKSAAIRDIVIGLGPRLDTGEIIQICVHSMVLNILTLKVHAKETHVSHKAGFKIL